VHAASVYVIADHDADGWRDVKIASVFPSVLRAKPSSSDFRNTFTRFGEKKDRQPAIGDFGASATFFGPIAAT